jgi:crossover junction endodeoxyribonuclease RuvC
MIVMGIDPGSRWTGFGVLKVELRRDPIWLHSGVIDCTRGGDLSERSELSQRLGVLLNSLTQLVQVWQPQTMAVEKVFLGKNAESAFVLGQARGVVLAVAGQQGLPVSEYATRSVKKAITGRGTAEKTDVQFMLKALLGRQFSSLDESDAVAVALCHCRQIQIDGVIRGAEREGGL